MDVLMPQFGETVAEGTVVSWHKQVGDAVAVDEILLDIQTDKVSMEVPAPSAGVITAICVQAGVTVGVGTVLAVIDSGATASLPPPSSLPSLPRTASRGDLRGARRASSAPELRLSPAVRRLAAEHRLDLAAVHGTGRNGRITGRNVLEFLEARDRVSRATPAAAEASVMSTAPSPAPSARAPAPAVATRTLPFTPIRRLTAEHMVRSKATSPHVLQAVEVDFHHVDQVRKTVRDVWRTKHGHSLTYLPFIAHAVCRALGEFPNLNSTVLGDALVLHDHVNLAVAVDLGADGLVAPVIKAAEKLSVAQLSDAIAEIALRARSHRLKPDDFAAGTYTLSNSGTFGTLITAPIINQPQVAILSTDGVRKKPVVIESSAGDSIGIRPVGILAQSFDHRAVDGAYSAAFLDRVRRVLETSSWSVEI